MTLVILKPTLACNAACRYCSAAHEGSCGVMTQEVLHQTLNLFGAWAQRRGGGRLRLLWHGGEPLLMGSNFWEGVLEASERLGSSLGIQVEHSLQSNGTLVTAEKLPMLAQLLGPKGTVGTSFDPLPGIRELKGQPEGSYRARWDAAMSLLREAGIRYGILCVVHRLSLPRLDELYRDLRATHPEAGLRFNPLYRQGRAHEEGVWGDLGLTPSQWGDALRVLHGAWTREGRPASIQPFAPWDTLHRTGEWRLSCESSGNCAQTHFGVDPDGQVYLCGRSADGGTLRYGSVFDLDVDAIQNHPMRQMVSNRKVFLRRTSCRECPWWAYCHGGCVNDGILAQGTPFAPTSMCEGLRAFFEATFPSARAS